MPVSDEFKKAVDVAYSKAMNDFHSSKETLPFGFVKLQGFDGRTSESKFFKNDDRFDYNITSNSSHIAAPDGNTVSINKVSTQSVEKKKTAYKTFLKVMRGIGYLDDISVHTRLD